MLGVVRQVFNPSLLLLSTPGLYSLTELQCITPYTQGLQSGKCLLDSCFISMYVQLFSPSLVLLSAFDTPGMVLDTD